MFSVFSRIVWCLLLLVISCGTKAYSLPSRYNTDSLLKTARELNDPLQRTDAELNVVKNWSGVPNDSNIALLNRLIKHYEKNDNILARARAVSLKGWYYCFQARYEEALTLVHQALKLQQTQVNDATGTALSLNRLAIINLQFERYKESKKYFLQALQYFKELKDTIYIDLVVNNLGVWYYEKENYKKAIDYYRTSQRIREELGRWYWVGYSLYNIASCYLDSQQYDSSGYYYLNAIETFSTRTERGKTPDMVWLGAAEYFMKTKDFESAEKYALQGLEDALKSNHVEMEIEGKKLLAKIYEKWGNNARALQYLHEYANLKNTLDSANNAGRVAEIELKYETALKNEEIAKLKSEKYESDIKKERAQFIALISVTVLLLLLAGVALIRFRNHQKRKREILELNANIAEARLMALRTQMNPHFIFNCINTAQNFVLNAQHREAYEYLADFAKLLRLVLENSGSNYIPLDDELKLCKLYIELEKIRFSENFNYDFIIDESLQNGVFEIPGMVLQPFIENAILHGLVHRKEGEKGWLKIVLVHKADMIICTIEDNGIGRKKAKEIKEQKQQHYQSAALLNIEKRLKILEVATKSHINFSIEDKYENSEASGTKVVIELPYR